ncbi:serine hydrolase domain-containing protein [Flavobacterium caeni]|uniref:CubicO group peptidase, beta-lactamase class C family n=1 Tax=Flavobacterium caeni TaxID=490189 RepID=A0A1G5JDI4_9FLAO|nr:serine hydrolase [Flavobacterium caeni]SCY86385.1 CubicO group peptidase, beta-lactamase class C family [Flavobacterium caeni]
MKKRHWFGLIVVAALGVVVGVNYPKLDLISGFAAKSVATGHFADGRTLQMIEEGDNDIPLVDLALNNIDEKNKWATASVFGLNTRKAIYREGLGSVLVDDDFDTTKPYAIPKRTKGPVAAFPYGDAEPRDTFFDEVNYGRLQKAVDDAFDHNGNKTKRTRSVLVVYKDKIIAEKYDAGFSKKSRILGWSMTKSLTATYFGILQHQKKFDIFKPAPISEWRKDQRRNITTSNLLRMNSGLEWDENYETISDATQMLFLAKDMTAVQRDKCRAFAPNEHWNYSSGTTNLLSGILRKQFKTHQQYLDFWYASLIDKIGMHSMFVETDMSGNFVGSSYGWATTRDWAKFGLLYLHKGQWKNERLFDEKWIDYVTTPAKGSNDHYGGHFWINKGGYYPDAPRDLYSANGFQGQHVFIVPSKDLVIVRMGLKENPGFDFNHFLKEITGSIKKVKA